MGFKRPLVRIQSLGPRRSKLCIACSDFFLKVRARSRRCASFPTATRRAAVSDIAARRWSFTDAACPLRVLRWARSWWAALRAAFFSTKMSILTISPPKRIEIARFQAFFTLSWQNGIVKLSFTNTREMGNGYHLGGAVPEIFIDNFTARWYSTREKTAMTEKSPQLSVQREARQVKGLYGRRRAVPLPSGPG